jgi:DNA-binding transcriptional LysR family regulator
MMELRRLRLLHEFSRRGTVAAVAEALSYSPSSVSVQLAELEREAGTKLLRRTGRTLELTAAGTRLAEHAAQALTADEKVRAELASLTGAPRGRVRLTFVQTPALALLSGAMAELARTAPDLRVEVVHRETAPALAELRSRAVDVVVGIDYDPVPVPRHRDVDRRDLIREAVLLCVPVDHPLAATDGPIPIAAVEHAAWAADFPGSGHNAAVEHLCNRLGGYAPDIRHRTDDALILRALVASGQAVTILAALIATAIPQVAARPLAEGAVHRTIFTATRTAASHAPAVEAVRAALRNAAQTATTGRKDVTLIEE